MSKESIRDILNRRFGQASEAQSHAVLEDFAMRMAESIETQNKYGEYSQLMEKQREINAAHITEEK